MWYNDILRTTARQDVPPVRLQKFLIHATSWGRNPALVLRFLVIIGLFIFIYFYLFLEKHTICCQVKKGSHCDTLQIIDLVAEQKIHAARNWKLSLVTFSVWSSVKKSEGEGQSRCDWMTRIMKRGGDGTSWGMWLFRNREGERGGEFVCGEKVKKVRSDDDDDDDRKVDCVCCESSSCYRIVY